MGELEGKGMLMLPRCETGVVGLEELAESDDADETENERGLLRLGMGSGLVDFSLEDIEREKKN